MSRIGPAHARGFTLLEMLIALGVTALVVALAFTAFGMVGRSEERNQLGMERTERMLVVSQWLTRKFDGLRPLSRVEPGAVVTPFFSGNAAGAMWVAPLPERGDGGGLHVLRLSPLRHTGGGIDLVVEALPFNGSDMVLDWGQALRQVLLADVRSLQWYYQDGLSGEWRREWVGIARYPVRVKIELGDEKGDWPALVLALPGGR